MSYKRFDVKTKYLHMPAALVSLGQYSDETMAVMLRDEEGIEKISINLIDYYNDGVPKPEADQFYVKNYSEHEGMAFALRDAGIADTIRPVIFGPYDTAAYLMQLKKELLPVSYPEGREN